MLIDASKLSMTPQTLYPLEIRLRLKISYIFSSLLTLPRANRMTYTIAALTSAIALIVKSLGEVAAGYIKHYGLKTANRPKQALAILHTHTGYLKFQ